MQSSDYYAVLEVTPRASLTEIKRSYRRLAMQYHPDRNQDDTTAETRFKEITIAYKTLSDNKKRSTYDQQQWYYRHNNTPSSKPNTPYAVFMQCRQLEKYLSKLDVYRMDKDGLYQYIQQLIAPATLTMLHASGDVVTNREIISCLLRSMHPLTFAQAGHIAVQLLQLAGTDEEMKITITDWLKKHKQRHAWKRLEWVIVLLLTVLLCWLLYLSAR